MKSSLESLENTVLELGTELYVVKSQVKKLNRQNEELRKLVESFHILLEERGFEQDDLRAATTNFESDITDLSDDADYDAFDAESYHPKKMSH